MEGNIKNSIIIVGNPKKIFEFTNDVENWKLLFDEYESVNIIEKDTDYVKFELVTVADKEGQIKRWTSERFTDSANMQVKANRLNPLFPFEYMKIYWTYEILPNDCGVFLTWRQRFVLDKKCPYSLCEMESYLNRTSIHELERIRERMEKILNEK